MNFDGVTDVGVIFLLAGVSIWDIKPHLGRMTQRENKSSLSGKRQTINKHKQLLQSGKPLTLFSYIINHLHLRAHRQKAITIAAILCLDA